MNYHVEDSKDFANIVSDPLNKSPDLAVELYFAKALPETLVGF